VNRQLTSNAEDGPNRPSPSGRGGTRLSAVLLLGHRFPICSLVVPSRQGGWRSRRAYAPLCSETLMLHSVGILGVLHEYACGALRGTRLRGSRALSGRPLRRFVTTWCEKDGLERLSGFGALKRLPHWREQ